MSFQTISNDMPQNFSFTNFFQTENLNDRVQQIADNAEMTAADMKIQEQLMASDKRYNLVHLKNWTLFDIKKEHVKISKIAKFGCDML